MVDANLYKFYPTQIRNLLNQLLVVYYIFLKYNLDVLYNLYYF
nr:MAG TPA: hypothetical protein [Caudoviricetes sp.]